MRYILFLFMTISFCAKAQSIDSDIQSINAHKYDKKIKHYINKNAPFYNNSYSQIPVFYANYDSTKTDVPVNARLSIRKSESNKNPFYLNISKTGIDTIGDPIAIIDENGKFYLLQVIPVPLNYIVMIYKKFDCDFLCIIDNVNSVLNLEVKLEWNIIARIKGSFYKIVLKDPSFYKFSNEIKYWDMSIEERKRFNDDAVYQISHTDFSLEANMTMELIE